MTEILLNDATVPCETEVKFRVKNERKHWCQRCPGIPCTAVQAVVLGSVVVGLVITCIVLDVLKPTGGHEETYHKDLVKKINAANLTWKAEYNKFASKAPNRGNVPFPLSMEREKELQKLEKETDATNVHLKSMTEENTSEHLSKLSQIQGALPRSFDARLKWPQCTTLHDVRNQGGCGSCWAISAVAVMSDRICIHSNGTQQPRISTYDLLSCCSNCSGCHGELFPLTSFLYWRDEGIVTGGGYGSYEGCKPYPYSSACGLPCTNKVYRSQQNKERCVKSCQSLYYSKTYDQDKYFASSVYNLEAIILTKTAKSDNEGKNTEVKIDILKQELMTFGPVHTCFNLVEDFQHYKSGVYKKSKFTLGKVVYGHCVKIIGWGYTDDGILYWQAVNSWGRDWGEFGLFRFHVDETPDEWLAGIPRLHA